jgi:hypothetical protein
MARASSRTGGRSTATMSAAPATAAHAASIPSGPLTANATSVKARTASGARGARVSPLATGAGLTASSPRKARRWATHSIAIAIAHGTTMSAAKRVNDTCAARKARRFVRFETGRRSEAELARCVQA